MNYIKKKLCGFKRIIQLGTFRGHKVQMIYLFIYFLCFVYTRVVEQSKHEKKGPCNVLA